MKQCYSDIRQLEAVVPERRKTNVVSSKIVPAYRMKIFQSAMQGGKIHGDPPEGSS